MRFVAQPNLPMHQAAIQMPKCCQKFRSVSLKVFVPTDFVPWHRSALLAFERAKLSLGNNIP